MTAPSQPVTLEGLAQALREVAEMSRAGLAPPAVWQPLLGSEKGAGQGGLEAWAGQVASGPLATYATAVCAIDQISTSVGCAIGDMLTSLIESIQAHQDTAEAMEAAVAGPKASARMLQFLPLAGLGLGLIMGVNVLAVLSDAGPGTLALVVGLTLMLLGRAWSSLLLRRAAGRIDLDGLVAIDVLVAALSAGLPIGPALCAAGRAWPGVTGRALAQVGTALETGCQWEEAWRGQAGGQVLAGVERALWLSWRSGVRCGGLLRALKTSVLRAERQRCVKASARLSVTLMAPLGLCYLPAFMALGLAPLIISLAASLTTF
ncbi:MAG: type II secretion system F family protein [Micrococcales bacterium]|nr:type II secretion system F family protein [Micrococcales bacterium]